MKSRLLLAALVMPILALPACKPKSAAGAAARNDVAKADMPILPVTKGDVWNYEVTLEIPENTTSPGAAEVSQRFKRTRTYIGKISPAEGLPEVDCFEVTVPGSPAEREFVEIREDKVMMRGSMIMRPDTTKPMWLDHAVPFVVAGMKPGTETPEVSAPGGALSRKTQVVAREAVTVKAGTFQAIRLLMTGMDGEIELRRTIWFAPGKGIVREEKARYRKGALIYRENQELVEMRTTGNTR